MGIVAIYFVKFCPLSISCLKKFRKRKMLRRVFSGGSSSRSATRPAYHEPGEGSLRAANVKACQWPCETVMVDGGIKEEFDIFIENVRLTDFLADKCAQYHHLTNFA